MKTGKMKTGGPVKVTIHFRLSEQGQRGEIKRGRSGERDKSIEGKISPEDVDLFKVDSAGRLLAEGSFDSMPTIDELVRRARTSDEGRQRTTRLIKADEEE
jgi:hypothetical protein